MSVTCTCPNCRNEGPFEELIAYDRVVCGVCGLVLLKAPGWEGGECMTDFMTVWDGCEKCRPNEAGDEPSIDPPPLDERKER